jgi:hypothetical protein
MPSGRQSCACAARGKAAPPKIAGVLATAIAPALSTSLLFAIFFSPAHCK